MNFRTLLIIVLIFIRYTTHVEAQHVVSIDDVDYDEETCTITNYKWPENGRENIIVPSHFGDLKIKNIGVACFLNVSYMTDSNSGLKKVTIESGIEQIEHSAFLYNKITVLNLNEDLKVIGDYCFCGSLISAGDLILPNSITSIGTCAFGGCGITSVTLPENIKHIGYRCFESNLLTHIVIPSGVSRIEEDAFHCNRISDLVIAGEVGYLSGFGGNNLQNIVIPGTVDTIGQMAFCDNPLVNVNIEYGVKEIGVFSFASFLRGIDGLETISKLEHIDIPSTVRVIRGGAFYHNHNLNTVSFSEGLTEICSEAFKYCSLQKIELPASLKSVGEGAFSANQICDIRFSRGLEEIGPYAFQRNNLADIALPSTLMKIGVGAFYYTGANEISLPTMNGAKCWDMFSGDVVSERNVTAISRANIGLPYSYRAHFTDSQASRESVVLNGSQRVVQCVDLHGRKVRGRGLNRFTRKAKRTIC